MQKGFQPKAGTGSPSGPPNMETAGRRGPIENASKVKRVETSNTYGKHVQMIWRRMCGSADRYVVMDPAEARLLARQLLQSADAAENEAPYCTLVSEILEP